MFLARIASGFRAVGKLIPHRMRNRQGKANTACIIAGVIGFGVVFLFVFAIGAAIMFPVFARAREAARKSSCQANLKEIGTAIALYTSDHNGMLPSSYLYGGSKTWNKQNFSNFAKVSGDTTGTSPVKSWPMLARPYLKNKDVLLCPADPGYSTSMSSQPGATISYFWKAAMDRAWYGEGKHRYRKEADFAFPADQMVVYEHNGWHWGDASKGLTNGVTINCLFLDSHVAARRIQNSGYTEKENPPEPLPRSGVGEPAWFNYNFDAGGNSTVTGPQWDPSNWGDNLQ
jgi:hypothetical protein